MTLTAHLSSPPSLLKMLSHNLRWKLVTALARSDLRGQELIVLVDEPANLVSYHLKQLRDHRLVTAHRSAADSRDLYYSLDLPLLRAAFRDSGRAIHPALAEPMTDPEPAALSPAVHPKRVLFLCTHNSARSQMAEGILRYFGGDTVEVASAGSDPQPVHPLAVSAMAEMGIDIAGQRPKHLDEYAGQTFDTIITVCDRVRETCPVFPGDPERIHWSFPDPAEVRGTQEERHRAFKQTAVQLATRIHHLLILMDRQ